MPRSHSPRTEPPLESQDQKVQIAQALSSHIFACDDVFWLGHDGIQVIHRKDLRFARLRARDTFRIPPTFCVYDPLVSFLYQELALSSCGVSLRACAPPPSWPGRPPLRVYPTLHFLGACTRAPLFFSPSRDGEAPFQSIAVLVQAHEQVFRPFDEPFHFLPSQNRGHNHQSLPPHRFSPAL